MSHLLEGLARPRWLVAIFLLCATPMGLGSALLTPFGMFPDGMSQIVRAEGLRYGEISGIPPTAGFPPTGMSAGDTASIGILEVVIAPQPVELLPPPADVAKLRWAKARPWGGTSYWPTQMAEYFPIYYAPAALALLAGQSAGLSPFSTLFLVRLAMLTAYLALGSAALALARRGGALLFAVLTLPTAINLAGSWNQDPLLIASCVLAAALLTRGTRPAWWGALAALTAVASAKAPYAPLLLLCLPPLTRGSGVWWRAGAILLASLLPGLWLLHLMLSGFQLYQHAPYHPGPLWPGPRDIWLHDVQPRYNLRVLLADPAQIILLPLHSVWVLWPAIWRLMLAMVGNDHGLIQPWEYPCLAVSLGLAALAAMAAPGWRKRDSALAALALFAAFIGMELSLYLTYDTAGVSLIIGVQSRYYLLFIPFFMFLCPAVMGCLAQPRLAPGWFGLPAIMLAAINAVALPLFIFHLYHAHP